MSAVAERFLVEKMAPKPVAELIVGALRDPVVGPVLTLGAGGVLVDLIDDSTVLLLPTNAEEIRAALAELKVSKLIEGYRGGASGDMNALVQLVASVADYVADNATRLEELDLNPVLVLPEGEGAIAVDAFIRMRS